MSFKSGKGVISLKDTESKQRWCVAGMGAMCEDSSQRCNCAARSLRLSWRARECSLDIGDAACKSKDGVTQFYRNLEHLEVNGWEFY